MNFGRFNQRFKVNPKYNAASNNHPVTELKTVVDSIAQECSVSGDNMLPLLRFSSSGFHVDITYATRVLVFAEPDLPRLFSLQA